MFKAQHTRRFVQRLCFDVKQSARTLPVVGAHSGDMCVRASSTIEKRVGSHNNVRALFIVELYLRIACLSYFFVSVSLHPPIKQNVVWWRTSQRASRCQDLHRRSARRRDVARDRRRLPPLRPHPQSLGCSTPAGFRVRRIRGLT